jgi:hypothetical protein
VRQEEAKDRLIRHPGDYKPPRTQPKWGDLLKRPIKERRNALPRLVAGVNGTLYSEAVVAEGAVVFAKACELGLEGIVSKRAGSLYRCGRSRKIKNPDFVRR